MAAAWLAAGQQGAGGSALGRVVLVAVAVLAVSAFAIMQAKARSQPRRPVAPRRRRPRRRPGSSEWQAEPPLYWPETRDDETPSGSRPDWRYPPGYEPYPLYDPARSPWVVRDEAARNPGRSLRPAFLGRLCVSRVFVWVTGKRDGWQRSGCARGTVRGVAEGVS